jgi:hypothetical protein
VKTRPSWEGIGPRLLGQRSRANKQPRLECINDPFSPGIAWRFQRAILILPIDIVGDSSHSGILDD